MEILEQPTVFGYDAYYKSTSSRDWINSATIGARNSFTDTIIGSTSIRVDPKLPYQIIVDIMALVDKTPTDSYNPSDCVHVVNLLTKNLFATELNTNQKDFLIDTIMMQSIPRLAWSFEWRDYKAATPADLAAKTAIVRSRLERLMKHLLRMAEYQIF